MKSQFKENACFDEKISPGNPVALLVDYSNFMWFWRQEFEMCVNRSHLPIFTLRNVKEKIRFFKSHKYSQLNRGYFYSLNCSWTNWPDFLPKHINILYSIHSLVASLGNENTVIENGWPLKCFHLIIVHTVAKKCPKNHISIIGRKCTCKASFIPVL